MSEGTPIDTPPEVESRPEPVDDLKPPSIAVREPKQKNMTSVIGEWVGIILAAVLAAFLIKTFVVQTFWIPSASMEDTLLINDRVLVNKLAYDIDSVHRGDIVVFKRPPGETDKSIDDLIKRVIGLPGDTIEAINGQVYINDKPIDEPYVRGNEQTRNLPKRTLEDDQYFVMGDNRENSTDSRVFGPISESYIVGKAAVRIWPLSRIGGL